MTIQQVIINKISLSFIVSHVILTVIVPLSNYIHRNICKYVIYIYIYIYIYIHTLEHVSKYVKERLRYYIIMLKKNMYNFVYMYIYICICIYVYICMYIYAFIITYNIRITIMYHDNHNNNVSLNTCNSHVYRASELYGRRLAVAKKSQSQVVSHNCTKLFPLYLDGPTRCRSVGFAAMSWGRTSIW